MSMPFLLFFPFKPCTQGRILITSGNIVIRHQHTATQSFISTGDLIFYCKRHLYFIKIYIHRLLACQNCPSSSLRRGQEAIKYVSKNIKFRFDSTQRGFCFPWHFSHSLQIAVYLSLFVIVFLIKFLKRYTVFCGFIANNYWSRLLIDPC